MPRKPTRRILPFRIPFFRIFYSTTYTTLYIITLTFLAITPITLIWTAVSVKAFQYVIMVGGIYLLVAVTAIFIYSSRLYTNRSVLAAVGKSYVPVEEGELGRSVRKMIVKQMERSAIVTWESKPRDLVGEILRAEREGVLPPETGSVGRNDYMVGRIIQVDPVYPPWGVIEHAGWSSPSHRDDNATPDVQFANVVEELPNLVEVRAVSLAPPDPTMTHREDAQLMADPAVLELLARPETMGMRDYLTQLSYLGLINPPELGQSFLLKYERARFCGRPITEAEFGKLMASFSELLAGMTGLEAAIIEQIRAQVSNKALASDSMSSFSLSAPDRVRRYVTPSPAPHSPGSSLRSPVTAREAPSRNITPYLQQQGLGTPSLKSFGSVIHHESDDIEPEVLRYDGPRRSASIRTDSTTLESASVASLPSDAGSVLIHNSSPGYEHENG